MIITFIRCYGSIPMPHFRIPLTTTEFEIPDEWWAFAEMNKFTLDGVRHYPASRGSDWKPVSIDEVEPPKRNGGIEPFKKYKLMPVLFAFQSPECELPPVEVCEASEGPYRFKVRNGYHRYYASLAVGYRKLPVSHA
jgi:hypothetical protein